ncbi:MAG: hypothetical protein J7525_14135 [Roseofilum sp. SID3]|uniref:TraX family protein n=1 Tax=Roseofilum sp. SID3 TaxID=2821499 RepID=UPI001B054EDC|nr:TraX family protein [Roseofilum sp. SID3]MBP0014232.1 hypothetical protein [Roseofilum sp. SID3]
MNIALLKWFAYLSMICDHVGYVFFPQIYYFRILGRFAFPIFAATFIKGFKASKHKSLISKKLFFYTVITQVAIALLGKTDFNILFPFLLFSLQVHFANHRIKWFRYIPLCLVPLYHWCDYGLYGFALLCFFWWYPRKAGDRLLYYALLTVASGLIFEYNAYELLAFPAVDLAMRCDRWGPRYNFYFLYTFQWWAIMVAYSLVNYWYTA